MQQSYFRSYIFCLVFIIFFPLPWEDYFVGVKLLLGEVSWPFLPHHSHLLQSFQFWLVRIRHYPVPFTTNLQTIKRRNAHLSGKKSFTSFRNFRKKEEMKDERTMLVEIDSFLILFLCSRCGSEPQPTSEATIRV